MASSSPNLLHYLESIQTSQQRVQSKVLQYLQKALGKNVSYSIEDILDEHCQLMQCIMLGFTQDARYLISYAAHCLTVPTHETNTNDPPTPGLYLQLWRFAPPMPCRLVLQTPLFATASSVLGEACVSLPEAWEELLMEVGIAIAEHGGCLVVVGRVPMPHIPNPADVSRCFHQQHITLVPLPQHHLSTPSNAPPIHHVQVQHLFPSQTPEHAGLLCSVASGRIAPPLVGPPSGMLLVHQGCVRLLTWCVRPSVTALGVTGREIHTSREEMHTRGEMHNNMSDGDKGAHDKGVFQQECGGLEGLTVVQSSVPVLSPVVFSQDITGTSIGDMTGTSMGDMTGTSIAHVTPAHMDIGATPLLHSKANNTLWGGSKAACLVLDMVLHPWALDPEPLTMHHLGQSLGEPLELQELALDVLLAVPLSTTEWVNSQQSGFESHHNRTTHDTTKQTTTKQTTTKQTVSCPQHASPIVYPPHPKQQITPRGPCRMTGLPQYIPSTPPSKDTPTPHCITPCPALHPLQLLVLARVQADDVQEHDIQAHDLHADRPQRKTPPPPSTTPPPKPVRKAPLPQRVLLLEWELDRATGAVSVLHVAEVHLKKEQQGDGYTDSWSKVGLLRKVCWLQRLLRLRRLHQHMRPGMLPHWMANTSVLDNGTSLKSLVHPRLPLQLTGFVRDAPS